MYRIPLTVEGVDLHDEGVREAIAAGGCDDLAWQSIDGRVIATMFTEGADPVSDAVDVARRLHCAVASARVRQVDLELVSISDVAANIGVNRETVRLWVEGKRGPGGFPTPVGNPGASKVWRWPDVASWLRTNFGLRDDDADFLTPDQVARLNASLLQVFEAVDEEWHHVNLPLPLPLISAPAGQPSILMFPHHGADVGVSNLTLDAGMAAWHVFSIGSALHAATTRPRESDTDSSSEASSDVLNV